MGDQVRALYSSSCVVRIPEVGDTIFKIRGWVLPCDRIEPGNLRAAANVAANVCEAVSEKPFYDS